MQGGASLTLGWVVEFLRNFRRGDYAGWCFADPGSLILQLIEKVSHFFANLLVWLRLRRDRLGC